MSDQPPSGPVDPVSPPPPGDRGRADPTSSPVPVTDPSAVPGQGAAPAVPAATDPAAPVVPGQPGVPYPAGQPQEWSWSAPGGPAGPYATAYPGGPYASGPYPGAPYPAAPYPGGAYPGWYPAGAGWDPNDPLVTPPHAGIGGWFARCAGAVRRGWRLLVPIMLLTQAAPAAVISVLSLALAPSGEVGTAADGAPVLPDGYFRDVLAFYAAVLAASLILGPVQSLGWAAGTWVVTRQAAGEPVGLGAAFRFGLRRVLGLWGWTLLSSLLIGVGVCFCLLPGLYLAFAFALVGPVYLFERENPIGRSFRIFHQRFGMVLGRVALVVAALLVGILVGFVVEAVGQLPFGTHPMDSPGTAAGSAAVALVAAVLVVPVYLAQLVGLLVTYAEQRAHEGPVNAARLATELG
ncbi:hypothetical protein GCM10023176_29480 [Micromonospora coerulea]|uniref:Glycerophosphoryl diester phosphodiesterase family protein n=1 Tax=Micromonospora coerulea TaxID=47856 RepID=A0ABP8SJM5_9ACTN